MTPLALAVAGSVAAWAITVLATALYKRKSVLKAVEDDVHRVQQEICETRDYLDKFMQEWFVVGKIFETKTHSAETVYVIPALTSEIVSYAPDFLNRVMAFRVAIRKVDVLFKFLNDDILDKATSKHELTAGEVLALKERARRILSLADEILRFRDQPLRRLPDAYPDSTGLEMLQRIEVKPSE